MNKYPTEYVQDEIVNEEDLHDKTVDEPKGGIIIENDEEGVSPAPAAVQREINRLSKNGDATLILPTRTRQQSRNEATNVTSNNMMASLRKL